MQNLNFFKYIYIYIYSKLMEIENKSRTQAGQIFQNICKNPNLKIK
jgi:hypothetical protein